MSTRTATHATFVIERHYDSPVEAVWSAFADPEVKARWFAGPEGVTDPVSSEDFTVGGLAINDATFPDGTRSRFRAVYTDIVERERIVYVYDMWRDDLHASTSVSTFEFAAEGDGTRLTCTEQGVHLDGVHGPGPEAAAGREHGTSLLLEAIAGAIGGVVTTPPCD